MCRRLFGLIFVAALMIAGTGGYDTNAKIKAVYIYNFTKYIEWPKEYREQVFVIGILGESSLVKELEGMSSSKKVFGQDIEVKQFADLSQVSKCHILYMPSDSKEQIGNVLNKIKGYSTLLVTDTPGLATKGSAINFVVL